MASTMISTNYV